MRGYGSRWCGTEGYLSLRVPVDGLASSEITASRMLHLALGPNIFGSDEPYLGRTIFGEHIISPGYQWQSWARCFSLFFFFLPQTTFPFHCTNDRADPKSSQTTACLRALGHARTWVRCHHKTSPRKWHFSGWHLDPHYSPPTCTAQLWLGLLRTTSGGEKNTLLIFLFLASRSWKSGRVEESLWAGCAERALQLGRCTHGKAVWDRERLWACHRRESVQTGVWRSPRSARLRAPRYLHSARRGQIRHRQHP